MSKLKDYFEKKRIIKEGLPKIWFVKSNRNGVELPKEIQVIEIVKNSGVMNYFSSNKNMDDISLNKKLPIHKYKMKEAPYSIDIVEGKTSSINTGTGTGFGDLWEWNDFISFTKEEADKYYIEENKRIFEKYLKNA